MDGFTHQKKAVAQDISRPYRWFQVHIPIFPASRSFSVKDCSLRDSGDLQPVYIIVAIHLADTLTQVLQALGSGLAGKGLARREALACPVSWDTFQLIKPNNMHTLVRKEMLPICVLDFCPSWLLKQVILPPLSLLRFQPELPQPNQGHNTFPNFLRQWNWGWGWGGGGGRITCVLASPASHRLTHCFPTEIL